MTTNMENPVVLSGCGWVSPLGIGSISDVLSSVEDASNPVPRDGGYLAVPDDPPHADLSALAKELQRNKGAWMAAIAVGHACRTALLPMEQLDSDRAGLALGCGLAGQLGMIEFASEVRQQSARFVSPIHFPQTVGNYIAGALARSCKLRGPNVTLACGAASSLVAIGEASAWITHDTADIVLAGGVEELSPAVAAGFNAPDTVLGEGACFFVVERADRAIARGVRPLATVDGWSGTDDGAPPSTIVSVAGFRLGGAILVEHLLGLCIGASGAAATACAIGAAAGQAVPMVDAADHDAVTDRSTAVKALRGSDGFVRATILAASDARTGSRCARLDLSIWK